MNKVIKNSIVEVLNNCGSITYKISGKSMEPMISPNRDIVTIKRKTNREKLHVNDVVLYRQKGKLILHRIVKVLPKGEYVILGDNCSRREYGICEDDIVGVLTSFKHNGVHYETTDSKYIDYVKRLRETENVRTKRKLIYDIIVQHLRFLPSSFYSILKSFLKKKIVYHISFI
jgi:signal peptidase I